MSTYSNKEEISIKRVVELFNKKKFRKEKDPKIYKKLENKTWWYHFSYSNTKNQEYFTIVNPYLYYGKMYIYVSDSIIPLHKSSYKKEYPHKSIFYRHPVWKIPKKYKKADLFLELRNDGGRSRLEFNLESQNDFLKRVETEYFTFGLYIAFLLSMVIVLLIFSFLKKEYSVIFYAFYILCMLVEFLAAKGIGIQFLWADNSFLINSSRSFSQTLGTFSIGLFYSNFYKFNKNQLISKNIFKWGSYLLIPFICIYIYKFAYGGLGSFYLFVWVSLKLIIAFWFFNHLYLISKKIIPIYLVFAFSLPIFIIATNGFYNPSVFEPYNFLKQFNLFYVTVILEILLFTNYIFSSVIKTQRKYFKLKEFSNKLEIDLQNQALTIQQEERNKLLNDVHDSFGGYLEALKLRLLNKTKNTTEKVQEIIDAFDKEYRFLLNNLYSPKISAENLIDNLIQFCNKLNEFTDKNIKHSFVLEETTISKEICLHLYQISSELTTNAIKYSQASEIKIKLSKDINNKSISLIVSDNGIGFNPKEKHSNSYGLQSIKKRVELMKGTINIESTKNLGTTITIIIPLYE